MEEGEVVAFFNGVRRVEASELSRKGWRHSSSSSLLTLSFDPLP